MTENEAQKWLERFEWDDSEETSEALATICEALQEYPKFKAIGTVEELQELKGVITDFPLDCGDTVTTFKEILHQLSEYLKIGTIEDFKALARSERNKAIDEVFDFLKSQRGKKSMKVNFDDLEIRKYKDQLKGGAV